ncbi:MAG: hypothetical protein L6V84_03370 [Oscillospiraceae bacterium]|nr:MAG: hypothetical protein L6V84_03370 [Oscillospiraceae bacterium]
MPTFQSSPLNPAISWLFLGYFLVLFAERVQSLARICRTSFAALYRTGFDGFVDTLTVLSLVATVLLLAFGCKGYWQSLCQSRRHPGLFHADGHGTGVMLVSGMMHTEYTVAPVQFVSYGMLIIAMVLRTVQTVAGADHPGMFWYSLAFLTVFSMAIPVMYRAEIAHATLFHVIEAIVALALVACFTWMLRDLFLGQGHDLLRWVPMLIAAVGDAVILAMRWKETVNTFVLIFVILSAVVFAVGKVLFAAQLL